MLKFNHIIIITLISLIVCLIFFINSQKINHFNLIDSSGRTTTSLNSKNKNHQVSSASNKLLNINYHLILSNESLCINYSSKLLAVFIITSHYSNIETRNSIRQVFNNKFINIFQFRKVFLLGVSPSDKYVAQTTIENENKEFGDILQSNIIEAYRNLTYKHLIGLKWIEKYCKNVKYVIKMDDDTVVNMYNIGTLLQLLNKFSNENFIAGYILKNQQPIREPSNKWFVTKDEYNLDIYPSFVSGWFYITNQQTIRSLLTDINQQNFFWIDDVFVTGILREKMANIILYNLSDYFIVNSEFLQCCLQDFERNIYCDITIGPNGGDVNMFSTFNNKINYCLTKKKKCTKRTKPLNVTCVAERKINPGKGFAIVKSFNLI